MVMPGRAVDAVAPVGRVAPKDEMSCNPSALESVAYSVVPKIATHRISR